MKILIALAGIVGSTLLRGFTLAILWTWFIAGPQAPFSGLPELSLLDALGVAIVVSFVTYHGQIGTERESSDETEGFGEILIEGIVSSVNFYGAIWLIAGVVHAMQA